MQPRSYVAQPGQAGDERQPDTGAPGWWSDWGNRALAGLAVYVATYLLWLGSGWGSETLYLGVTEFGFAPVSLLGIVFVVRAIRTLTGDRQTQQAWALIGVGLALFAIADGIWGWYVILDESAPFPSIADVFYLTSMLALLVGVLRFPAPSFARGEIVRYGIDAGIILVGGGALVGYLVIGSDSLVREAITIDSALLLAYPVADLLLIIAVSFMMLRRPRAGKIGVLSLLAAGVIGIAAANLWWVYLEVNAGYLFGGAVYGLWMVGYALLVASPQRQVDVIRRQLPVACPGERAIRVRSLFPFVGAGVAFSVFIFAAAPQMVEQYGILLVFMVILATLIVVRQVVTLRDNARLQIEQVRKESDERVRALVEYSSDMIAVLDTKLRFQFQSPASVEFIRVAPEEFVGTFLRDWAHEEDREHVEHTLMELFEHRSEDVRFEWRMVGPSGNYIDLETIASNELQTPGVEGIVINSRDISERKLFERELTYQAYHDSLTGLPNRTSFLNSVVRQMRSTRPGNAMAMMFIDLDRFKPVNDTLGHDAGDELLKQVAGRLGLSLREGDILSRFAGDEFTVLLPNISSADEAMTVAERLRQVMDQPFTIADTEVSISSSIGVGYTETSFIEPHEMLRRADAAMYAAKRNGRNRVELFEPWMEEEMVTMEEERAEVHSRLASK
jgi:diguanylate cyclase (GGDEF)-like protein/PAS domain S-box-containing protein